jgi:autotransporter strand-loop-strand O-heptosyltransferase
MSSVSFKVDYMCYLPKEGNSPKVTIIGDDEEEFLVQFIDAKTMEIIFHGICKTNQTIIGGRQWYTDWIIKVFDKENNLRFIDEFNPTGKVVFIKSDAYALGDNIAWIPYFEEFRKKHNCTVICSTFFNELFESEYPDLLFVKPDTRIGNVYAQYYVGANEENNIKYSPTNSKYIPLQQVPCDILGLDCKEIRPKVISMDNIEKPDFKYVCISEFASGSNKEWKYEGGWQRVVDYLIENGYQVVSISKEPTELKNVINLTGDYSLKDRVAQLTHAELFIGVSSGLAWLAWAVGIPVMMISDVTPEWHEFQSNMTRLINSPKNFVDYTPTEPTSCEKVLEELGRLLG